MPHASSGSMSSTNSGSSQFCITGTYKMRRCNMTSAPGIWATSEFLEMPIT
jgi:hypothetical protein